MLVCLVEAISALPLACVVPLPISRLATCLHASLDGLLSMTCHLLVEHCRSTLHPRWIVCDREGFTCFFGYFSLVLSLPRIHRGSRIASVVLVHRPASVAIPSVRHSQPSATWLPHISATWHPHRLVPTQTSRPQGPGRWGGGPGDRRWRTRPIEGSKGTSRSRCHVPARISRSELSMADSSWRHQRSKKQHTFDGMNAEANMEGRWRSAGGRTIASILATVMLMGSTRGEVSSRCQEVITAQREACLVPDREREQRQFGASARLDIEGLKVDSLTLPPGQLDQCCVGFIDLDTSGCLCEKEVVDEIMQQGQLTTAAEVYNLFSVSDVPAPFGCQITLRVDYDRSGVCSIIYPSEFFLESFFPQFLPLYDCVDGSCTRVRLSTPSPDEAEPPGSSPPIAPPRPQPGPPPEEEESPPATPPEDEESPPSTSPSGESEQSSPPPVAPSPPPGQDPAPPSREGSIGGGGIGIGGGGIGGGSIGGGSQGPSFDTYIGMFLDLRK